MGRVYDTSKVTDSKMFVTRNMAKEDTRYLSQTPKNYVEDNYYLKSLQDKIDADWRFRPNRVDVEIELKNNWGKEKFDNLEVVVQSVKSDTGTIISDDWRRIVFREIKYDCPIGTKFRIAPRYDYNVADDRKNIFLTINHTLDVSPTSAVVIRRCNGTLGSTYKDAKGVVQCHYEPAIQEGISGTDLHYSEVANDPGAALTIHVQHNEYTKNYYINQRFIIGYDRAYRITNIDKFYANSTYDPQNVGLLTLYLAIDELSAKDDLQKRIAYNKKEDDTHIIDHHDDGEYNIQITEPLPIPSELTTEDMVIRSYVYKGEEQLTDEVHYEFKLGRVSAERYGQYFTYTIDENSHRLTIKKIKYCASPLQIKLYVNDKISTTLSLSMSGLM